MIDDSLKSGQADPRCIKFPPTSHFNLVIRLPFIYLKYPFKYSYNNTGILHTLQRLN